MGHSNKGKNPEARLSRERESGGLKARKKRRYEEEDDDFYEQQEESSHHSSPPRKRSKVGSAIATKRPSKNRHSDERRSEYPDPRRLEYEEESPRRRHYEDDPKFPLDHPATPSRHHSHKVRVEASPTSRAHCRACGGVIREGETRIGSLYSYRTNTKSGDARHRYYHQDCCPERTQLKLVQGGSDDDEKQKAATERTKKLTGEARKKLETRLETSPTDQASCRACQQKIDKGELRVGFLYGFRYKLQAKDARYRFFHLECCPDHKMEVLLAGRVGGAEDNNEALRQEVEALKRSSSSSNNRMEISPNSKAHCRRCKEAIVKGQARVGLVYNGKKFKYFHFKCCRDRQKRQLFPEMETQDEVNEAFEDELKKVKQQRELRKRRIQRLLREEIEEIEEEEERKQGILQDAQRLMNCEVEYSKKERDEKKHFLQEEGKELQHRLQRLLLRFEAEQGKKDYGCFGFPRSTIDNIVMAMPESRQELLGVKGVGRFFMEHIGDDALKEIQKFRQRHHM